MIAKSMLFMTVAAIAVVGGGGPEMGEGAYVGAQDFGTLSGVASQYGWGRMESTIRVRQSGRTAKDLPVPLPQADVYFATIDCRDVGNWFQIRPTDLDELGRPHAWESAYATDCAGLADGGIGFMLFNRHTPMSRGYAEQWFQRVHSGEYDPVYVAEVDYETAVRWNTVGRGIHVELRRLSPPPTN